MPGSYVQKGTRPGPGFRRGYADAAHTGQQTQTKPGLDQGRELLWEQKEDTCISTAQEQDNWRTTPGQTVQERGQRLCAGVVFFRENPSSIWFALRLG